VSTLDPQTQSEVVEFQPGQSILIHFTRGQPLTQAMLGFYQVMGSRFDLSQELVLLNSWRVQFNKSGEYEQVLEIPQDAVPGEYMIFLTNGDKTGKDYFVRMQVPENGQVMPIDGYLASFFSVRK